MDLLSANHARAVLHNSRIHNDVRTLISTFCLFMCTHHHVLSQKSKHTPLLNIFSGFKSVVHDVVMVFKLSFSVDILLAGLHVNAQYEVCVHDRDQKRASVLIMRRYHVEPTTNFVSLVNVITHDILASANVLFQNQVILQLRDFKVCNHGSFVVQAPAHELICPDKGAQSLNGFVAVLLKNGHKRLHLTLPRWLQNAAKNKCSLLHSLLPEPAPLNKALVSESERLLREQQFVGGLWCQPHVMCNIVCDNILVRDMHGFLQGMPTYRTSIRCEIDLFVRHEHDFVEALFR